MSKHKRHQTNKKKQLHIFDISLISIQLILSIFLGYLAKKVLPMKYWMIVVVIFLALWLLVFYVLKNKKNSVKQMWVRIVSLVLSIFIAVGSVFAYKGVSVLNNITGGQYQTHVISVAVLKDSSYQDIKDLDNKNLGYVSSMDSDNINEAIEHITTKEKANVIKVDNANLKELEESLSKKECDAIIFSEAYRGIIEELNKNFTTETRVIYQYKIKETLGKNNSTVNVTKDSFNVYISGIDTYGPVSTVSRSDVNMIMTVNPRDKKILLTSIPRDYYVTLASFGAPDKLTHSGIYGIQETMDTVGNLIGIDINYYMRVNFASLINIVNAVGGIEVYVDQAVNVGGHYLSEGMNYMDGDTALAFSRERYSYSDGDRHRVRNQQAVITGLLNKLMSPAMITSYNSVLDAISGAFETNMSSNDIQKLIQMQVDSMSSWSIEQISLDGTGATSTNCYSMPGYELYVMEPDESTVQTAKQKIDEVSGK